LSKPYVLTSAAEADLRSIIRYTRKEWGDPQVRHYVTELEFGIAQLAEGRRHHRDLSSLYPELCGARVGRHFVFYLPRDKQPVLVLAILHERMDLMVRLSERFKD